MPTQDDIPTRAIHSVPSATVTTRLWQTRGVLVYFSLAVSGVAFAGLAGYEATRILRSADVGLTVQYRGAYVRAADARWQNVQPGDEIVSVNGVSVTSGSHARRMLRTVGEEGSTTVAFGRSGRSWQQSAYAAKRSFKANVALLLRVFNGIVILLLGAVAFILRPGDRVSWVFFLFTVALSTTIQTTVALDTRLSLTYIAFLGSLLLATSLGYHLVGLFPAPFPMFRKQPMLFYAMYPVTFVAIGLLAVAFPKPELEWLWAPTATVALVWNAVTVLATIGVLIAQHRFAKSSADSRDLPRWRAICMGLVLGAGIPALWNAFRMLSGTFGGEFDRNLTVAPLVIFPLLVGYALVRHNALAVDRFTAAVVGYGAALALLGAAFVGLLFGLPLAMGQSQLFESPVAGAAIAAGVIVAFAPVYRRVKNRVDRWFFRESAHGQRALSGLRQLANAVRSGDRGEGFFAALDTAMLLQPDRASVWLIDSQGRCLERMMHMGEAGDEATQLPRGSELGQAMVSGGGVTQLAPRELPDDAQAQLWALGLALGTPILAHGVFAGFLGVGRKLSGLPYDEDDLTFLESIAAEVSLILERSSMGEQQIGRYRIERRLGTGGMAEVYLAWQLGPGGFERKVALKRPLPHLAEDPDCIAMLLDEARIAAGLQHRNIVQVFEVDKHQGVYFIAMEFVDGPSLRRLLRDSTGRQQPIPATVAGGILTRVLDALDYAHTRTDEHGESTRLVHRDVTPGNVLLSRDGDVKLADFGIARATHRLHATRTGLAKGTLPYMAPEQAAGRPLDGRTDLYAAGAVLLEMLTGRKARPDGPLRSDSPPLQELAADAPVALARIGERAMAFRPEDRFSCAAEMRGALVDALEAPADEYALRQWVRERSSSFSEETASLSLAPTDTVG